jgi:hypothetical protein
MKYLCGQYIKRLIMIRTVITPENTDIQLSVSAMNQQIFKEIQTLKRQILPDERVILFGSRARGDARSDSDWDLLVLLNGKGKITGEEDTRYGYPFAELGWHHGVCICALLYSTEEWEKRKMSPFYKNVINEGIEIN